MTATTASVGDTVTYQPQGPDMRNRWTFQVLEVREDGDGAVYRWREGEGGENWVFAGHCVLGDGTPEPREPSRRDWRNPSSQTFTAEQAVAALVAEGYSEADVNAVLDSMVNVGFELDQPDDGYILTAAEVDLLRSQLRA